MSSIYLYTLFAIMKWETIFSCITALGAAVPATALAVAEPLPPINTHGVLAPIDINIPRAPRIAAAGNGNGNGNGGNGGNGGANDNGGDVTGNGGNVNVVGGANRHFPNSNIRGKRAAGNCPPGCNCYDCRNHQGNCPPGCECYRCQNSNECVAVVGCFKIVHPISTIAFTPIPFNKYNDCSRTCYEAGYSYGVHGNTNDFYNNNGYCHCIVS